jgi:hypothetical protein
VSGSVEIRETAISLGIFHTILERLGTISGEKPRVYEETVEEIKDDELEANLDA